MTSAVSDWLCGQVDAVRILAREVQLTIRSHDSAISHLMLDIVYICNEVNSKLKQSAREAEGGK